MNQRLIDSQQLAIISIGTETVARIGFDRVTHSNNIRAIGINPLEAFGQGIGIPRFEEPAGLFSHKVRNTADV